MSKCIKICAFVSLVLIFLIPSIVFASPTLGTTSTKTWNFSNSSDYSYDSSKVSVNVGSAGLTAPADWYDNDWKYRIPIELTNSGESALTDYQVSIPLTTSNFDFSKAMEYGKDLRFTDSDGVTELNYWIEYYDHMNLATQTISPFNSVSNTQGWWHLDSGSDVQDSSGNGNTGTFGGNATLIGSSLKTDGYSDYVTIPDNGTLDFSSSFSIELWIRPDLLPLHTKSYFIVSKGGVGDGTGIDHNYYFILSNYDPGFSVSTTQALIFGFENLAGTNSQVIEKVQLNIGQWYHIVGVFDDVNDTLKLYRNGRLVATQTGVTATPNVQDEPVYLGARTTTTDSFEGRINEVRITGDILTPEEILADYELTAKNAKIWVKIPNINASSSKNIYMYYGLPVESNLSVGIVSDSHGVLDEADKKGSSATTLLSDWVYFMNNILVPDWTISLGDHIEDVIHDTDITNLGTLKAIFDTLNTTHYYLPGNHDYGNITRNEFKTAMGIDYTHKSFDHGDYHIVILDTEDDLNPNAGALTSAELTWLTDDLASSSKKTLVFSHQALDGQAAALSQYFRSNGEQNLSNASAVRTILENDGDVIGVFNGHVHTNNFSIVNDIPYFTFASLVEDMGKEWADLEIVNDKYLIVTYRQNGDFKKMYIWDFVNNKQYNNPNSTFLFFDDFDGDTGRWSELSGASTGDWRISSGSGVLMDTNLSAGAHKILKSTFTEPTNYVAEARVSLNYPNGTYIGFASKVTDSSNFDALYLVNSATPGVRWKQMDLGTWETIYETADFSPDRYWHNLKMEKIGNQRNLYYDTVNKISTTNSDLSGTGFGIWNYSNPTFLDNLRIRAYSATTPTDTPGTEDVVYDTGDPTISLQSSASQPFGTITGFSESASKNGGEIKYQISKDNGVTWYWYNSGWVEATGGYSQANTASQINSNISTFSSSSGDFAFKAYLHSDGTQQVVLNSVTLTYSSQSAVSESTNENNSSTNTTTSSVCSATKPTGSAPWIYKTEAISDGSITIWYSDFEIPITHYVLEYGTEPGKYVFSANDIKNVGGYTVKNLLPNTKYYFRIRAINDCAGGDWSNTSEASTSLKSFSLTGTSLDQENVFTNKLEDQKVEENKDGYTVEVKVVDDSGVPKIGILVVLHSDPKNAYTDSNGIATFYNVEKGNHEIEIHDKIGIRRSEVTLEGNFQTIKVEAKLEKEEIGIPKDFKLVGIVLGLLLAGFIIGELILKITKRNKY